MADRTDLWWGRSWNPVTGWLPDFPCWANCWARSCAGLAAPTRDRQLLFAERLLWKYEPRTITFEPLYETKEMGDGKGS